MTNIASALKDEISRVSRREIRAETATLKKASATFRHQIAVLKKRIASLEKSAKSGQRAARRPPSAGAEPGPERLRFRPAGFAAHRKRLGLSAADMGLLVGASLQSVYAWEHGKVRPRAGQMRAIASVRKMGKREALARLEQLKQE
jgi:DNA-binding XRE family transcriptional regulator